VVGGDAINLLLATAAWNPSFWMRRFFVGLFRHSKIGGGHVGLSGDPSGVRFLKTG
jgi:hypothetical protein